MLLHFRDVNDERETLTMRYGSYAKSASVFLPLSHKKMRLSPIKQVRS
jgi:hypothetical protein